jgi:hypothetical protein
MIPSGLARVHGPVCSVFATAIAANRPFAEVYAFARGHLKKPPQWRGRLYRRELLALLAAYKVVTVPAEGFKGYSLSRALSELNLEGHYIVEVTGHILSVCGGKLYDQAYPQGVLIIAGVKGGPRVISVLRVLS